MKTICPYCKQEYPDTPDEYLETTVACSVCNKNFIAKKAKFCSECGAVSPGQAIKCADCGAFFPLISTKEAVPSSVQDYTPEPEKQSAEYDDDGEDCIFEDSGLLTTWEKWKDFRGRSCRREFILFLLQVVVLSAISPLAANFPVENVVLGLIALAMLGFGVALCVRRLHDIGLSGWWSPLLISHVVVLGLLLPV